MTNEQLDQLRILRMEYLALAAKIMDKSAEIGLMIDAEVRDQGIASALSAIAETIDPTHEDLWEHDTFLLSDADHEGSQLAYRIEELS